MVYRRARYVPNELNNLIDVHVYTSTLHGPVRVRIVVVQCNTSKVFTIIIIIITKHMYVVRSTVLYVIRLSTLEFH
jgi:hypothetical protein